MIQQLHSGVAPSEINKRLEAHLQKIPYGEVVEVEQELIAEGLPEEEVIKLCDVHTKALEGNIDHTNAKTVPSGHPVDTFLKENDALLEVITEIETVFEQIEKTAPESGITKQILQLKELYNRLLDVDKHYVRKENLLFPYLERYGITGPPKVMWAKHDETRRLLKSAKKILNKRDKVSHKDFVKLIELNLRPAASSVKEMTTKESEILFPMTLDRLSERDWFEIYTQTIEIGYCLYDPDTEWIPEGIEPEPESQSDSNNIQLKSGSFSVDELTAMLNALPVDLTFVDCNDKVKYFSQGTERIFPRNRSVLNRDVRLCHPPSSVNVVEQIISDFKTGKQDRAPFWIDLGGEFIHIEYFALRNQSGEYLGTLEVSQNLTEKRQLDGEQRLLAYAKKNNDG